MHKNTITAIIGGFSHNPEDNATDTEFGAGNRQNDGSWA